MTVKTLRRQLAASIAMTLVATVALGSSTYAWFTMSREVEVKNIRLVASVPEDLQISLGKLSTDDGSGEGYSTNEGFLVKTSTAENANNGNVDEPGTVSEYWSQSVDVSKYYKLGTIMPASSTDGQGIFFTPDASGVGKTLKTGAKFYMAVENDTPVDDESITTGKEYTGTFETTLHAITASDTWTPDLATAYNVTNDAGYYVDIPVWIRSSAKETVSLAVDAYVTTNSTIDGDDLYLAARAVILDEDKAATSKLLEIKKENYASTDSIVDFMDTTNAAGEAVASVTGTTPTYGTVTHYDGNVLTSLFTVPAADEDANFGDAVKVWVRVWLEGEDPNCWNDNAGQDFNICLKFTKDRLYNSADATTASVTQNYPDAASFTAYADDDANSLMAGDTVSVTGMITDANDPSANVAIAMTYTYNGTTWERTDGSYPGVTVYIGAEEIDDEADLISYITTNVATKADLAAITITETAAP